MSKSLTKLQSEALNRMGTRPRHWWTAREAKSTRGTLDSLVARGLVDSRRPLGSSFFPGLTEYRAVVLNPDNPT